MKNYVYYNNGELYKIETDAGTDKVSLAHFKSSDGVEGKSRYISINDNKHLPFASVKYDADGNKVAIKHYKMAEDVAELLNPLNTSGEKIPAEYKSDIVNMYLSVGLYNNDETFYEVYFMIDSVTQFTRLANEYGLHQPISDEQIGQIDLAVDGIELNHGSITTKVVVGSIAFVGGIATKFKVYVSKEL